LAFASCKNMHQRWPHVSRVKIKFTLLLTNWVRFHNNEFDEGPCKLNSTENLYSFEICPIPRSRKNINTIVKHNMTQLFFPRSKKNVTCLKERLTKKISKLGSVLKCDVQRRSIVRGDTEKIYTGRWGAGCRHTKSSTWGSESRSGDHEGPICRGYYGLHGEGQHVCQDVYTMVGQSRKHSLLRRAETSVSSTANVYANRSSSQIFDYYHWCVYH